jgi:hypothetical protein
MEISKNETVTSCKECRHFVGIYHTLPMCGAKLHTTLRTGTVEHFQEWDRVRYHFGYMEENDGCCGSFKPKDVGES